MFHIPANVSWDNMQTSTFGLNLSVLVWQFPWKLDQGHQNLISSSSCTKCYINANLVKICQPVHEISCIQTLFGSLSPAVTIKIRSRSPKPNQLFVVSQCHIHISMQIWLKSANQLIRYHAYKKLSHWHLQKRDPHQKQYVPLPFGGGGGGGWLGGGRET